jgi:hypothetical protein
MKDLIAIFIPPLNRAGFRYMVTGSDVEGISVTFSPPEYTILSKLEFYREGASEKHIRDIHGIIATGEPIRTAEVARFVAAKGLDELWRKHVLSKLQPAS